MNPRYDTNTNPNWLQKGDCVQSTSPTLAVPREPGFECAKSPLERMLTQLQNQLAIATNRSADDFSEEIHAYAALAGAQQADLTEIASTLEAFLTIHGLEGLKE